MRNVLLPFARRLLIYDAVTEDYVTLLSATSSPQHALVVGPCTPRASVQSLQAAESALVSVHTHIL